MHKILETIIGLEIHVQLKTESKMFCGCHNLPDGSEPNTNICPVCMGAVGSIPVVNKKAVDQVILTGLALGCAIQPRSKWDRKNYFYPDSPKGYQISQYDAPLALDGRVEILAKDGEFKFIGINRVHLEEDAAKLIHTGSETLVDFNRAGVPLMEIVTQPDLRSPEDAEIFLRELRRIVRYIAVSDADMQKGHLRCDASVSMRPVGAHVLYPRTEIKNLNSFKMVREALAYESEKFRRAWEADQVPNKPTTVLWDDKKKETRFMRAKEHAADYRYIPEPDIPEVVLNEAQIAAVKTTLPPLPIARLKNYLQAGIAKIMATATLERIDSADFLDAVLGFTAKDLELQKIAIKNFYRLFPDLNVGVAEFLRIAEAMRSGAVSGMAIKEIFEAIKSGRFKADMLSGEPNAKNLPFELEAIAGQVIEANPKIAAGFKAGKTRALNVLIGQVIKKTGREVPPEKIREFLLDKLN